MAVRGVSANYHRKHLFEVQIDGFKLASFSECSELSAEIGKIEHREGGAVIPNKSPGLLNFTDVTLKRGVTTDLDFFLWFSSVVNGAAAGLGSSNTGLSDGAYKRNLDLVQKDQDGSELARWSLAGAWPVKHIAGSWDNNAEEVVVEELTLTYDYYDRVA